MQRQKPQQFGAIKLWCSMPKKQSTRIGRPPLPAGKARTIRKSIRVSEDVAEYLADAGTGIVQTLIEKTTNYRAWQMRRRPKR